MSEPQRILDYASPRPLGRMRLPAESHIEIQSDGNSTTITETLKGRSTAIAAILFAIFVLIVLLGVIYAQGAYSHSHPSEGLFLPMFLSTLWIAEAVIGVLVLGQTYRKTVLHVRGDEVSLIFMGLFSGQRKHRWPIGEIGELRVELTQTMPEAPPLAELQIRPAHDLSVHLFTDHHELEVRQTATLLVRAINGEHVPYLAQPEVASPDQATFKRLLEKTRMLRE